MPLEAEADWVFGIIDYFLGAELAPSYGEGI